MATRQQARNHLKKKFQDWSSSNSGGRLEGFVNPKKRSGITSEFQKDITNLKRTVCPYIREAGYAQARLLVVEAAEGLVGRLFGIGFITPSTLDIIVGALMDVCGYSRMGDKLIEKGI